MSNPTPDDVLNVDITHLTVEEIEQIEDLTGQAIDAAMNPDKPKGKFLRALAFINGRRTDPEYTWELAGKMKVVLAEKPVPPTSDSD